jgi:chromosome segregation ATPase
LEINELKRTILDNQQAFNDEKTALKNTISSLQIELSNLKEILSEVKEQRDLLMTNLKKY